MWAVAPSDAVPCAHWGFSPVGLGPDGLRPVEPGGLYRSNGPDPFTLFLLFASFLINFKAQVSKIQIIFVVNSFFQIGQVDG
jgi:hypothetical protein